MCRLSFLALVLLTLSPSIVSATNFAILLAEPPEPDADRVSVENPLHRPGGLQGESPLHETQSIGVDPFDAWPGYPATLKLAMGESLPQNLPPAPDRALVFEVSLIEASSGDPIHQLPDELSIWLTTTSPQDAKYAFGTLNETTGLWEQMAVLAKDENGALCGYTNHLSYFYLAPVPEPSSIILAAIGTAVLALATMRAKWQSA